MSAIGEQVSIKSEFNIIAASKVTEQLTEYSAYFHQEINNRKLLETDANVIL